MALISIHAKSAAISSESMTLYCDWCRSGKASDIHIHHHDLEHGIPPTSDNQLFSRLCYEVLQAGLSWEIILKRRAGLDAVWHDFNVETIAGLSDSELAVITADVRNIRHAQKAVAIRHNAQVFSDLAMTHGSARAWLYGLGETDPKVWQTLFKTHFKFTGATIQDEFLMGTGVRIGAHAEECPRYAAALAAGAPWAVHAGITPIQPPTH